MNRQTQRLVNAMQFRHTKCGGRIDVENRTCTKCKKHWSKFGFQATNEIRPIQDRRGRVLLTPPKPRPPKGPRQPASYAKWGDRIPGVGAVASKLPNWPRWARILTAAVPILVVLYILFWR